MKSTYKFCVVTSRFYDKNQSDTLASVMEYALDNNIPLTIISDTMQCLEGENEVYGLISQGGFDRIAVLTDFVSRSDLTDRIAAEIGGGALTIIGENDPFPHISAEKLLLGKPKKTPGQFSLQAMDDILREEFFANLERVLVCSETPKRLVSELHAALSRFAPDGLETYLCVYANRSSMTVFDIIGEKSFPVPRFGALTERLCQSGFINLVTPLFSGFSYCGMMIFRFAEPIVFGIDCLRFLRTVSSALACRGLRKTGGTPILSEFYDRETGLLNKKGLLHGIESFAVSNNSDSILYITTVRLPLRQEINIGEEKKRSDLISSVAGSIARMAQGVGKLASRLNENTFVLAKTGSPQEDRTSETEDVINVLLCENASFIDLIGPQKALISHIKYDGSPAAEEVLDSIGKSAPEKVPEPKHSKRYSVLLNIRREVYKNPHKDFDLERVSGTVYTDAGYFRNIYKAFFGTSFHKDCTSAKIFRAKFHLITSSDGIREISEKCGFNDDKYFTRLFKKNAGYSPAQYRNRFHLD